MDKKYSDFGNTEKIRDTQREVQKAIRQHKKRCILSRDREYLSEVEKSLSHVTSEDMKEYALGLINSKKDQLLYLQRIRNGATFGEMQIEAFLRVPGALQKLVGCLCSKNAELLEAAACITNLTAGSHKSTQKVLKAAGPYLVTHMQGNDHLLQDHCAWAAGNIANDCDHCFSILKSHGAVPVLQTLLASTYPEVVQSALYAMNACTQYSSMDLQEVVRNGLPSCLIAILDQNDIAHSMSVEAMFVIWNISSAFECISKTELEKIVDVVLKHLDKATSDDFDVLLATPTLRCLGSISMGSSDLCKLILNYQVFQNNVNKIMSSNYNFLHKEVLWVLCNLLNYVDELENSAKWCWVLQFIRPYLSPLDDSAVQAIYFLCVLKATKKDFDVVFAASGLVEIVTPLCSCGKKEIETAAMAFCAMTNIHVPNVIC